MKNKLILIFNDSSEVMGINKSLIFNNILDAEKYLLSTEHITSIKIEPNDRYFSFKTIAWSGNGVATWAIDLS